jgi:cell fate regulator YaaT (PSP1 superfamily)
LSRNVLVRYGTISEVARCANASGTALPRGARVVVQTHRGVELGTLLEDAPVPATVDPESAEFPILRSSSQEDEQNARSLQAECSQRFRVWNDRIAGWKLQLELVDLEWTLDKSKLILYVLNDRGAECTKLALQAAAAGFEAVEVQPVGAQGLVPLERGGGGCGSGGCGSGDSGGCCH